MSEFSFVLASVAVADHLIGADVYTALLSSVVVTIAFATLAVRWGPWQRVAQAEATA